jgi:hypothetical protein
MTNQKSSVENKDQSDKRNFPTFTLPEALKPVTKLLEDVAS